MTLLDLEVTVGFGLVGPKVALELGRHPLQGDEFTHSLLSPLSLFVHFSLFLLPQARRSLSLPSSLGGRWDPALPTQPVRNLRATH